MAYQPPHPPLPRLRRLCLSLPETCETPTWGHPNFRAGKKIFVAFHADSHDVPCIWVQPGPMAPDIVKGDARFSQSRHGGTRWGGLRADLPLDWSLVQELVLESYRATASKTQVRQLDEAETMPRTRRTAASRT